MRITTPPQTILREALMFGVMVGIIATTAIALLSDWAFLNAALAGGLLACVVAFVLYTVGGDLPPPRGPGNLPEPTYKGTSDSTGSGTPTGGSAGGATASDAGPAPTASTGGAASAAPTPTPAETTAGKPAMLTEARGGQADDLKKIKGVGPKLEGVLHTMGVFHYDQVANWTETEVAWVDENLEGFKGRVTRDGWVAQAKALMAG
ncbi:MAG: NADH:ubiquinone oxidoreductase [Pseudomonadota bacterium]